MTATLQQRLSDLAESAGLNAPIGAMAWAAYAGEEELQRVLAGGADHPLFGLSAGRERLARPARDGRLDVVASPPPPDRTSERSAPRPLAPLHIFHLNRTMTACRSQQRSVLNPPKPRHIAWVGLTGPWVPISGGLRPVWEGVRSHASARRSHGTVRQGPCRHAPVRMASAPARRRTTASEPRVHTFA